MNRSVFRDPECSDLDYAFSFCVAIEGSAVQHLRFIGEQAALDWNGKRHFDMPATFIPCARCSTAECVQFHGAVHFNVANCSGHSVHSAVSLVGQGHQSVQHIGQMVARFSSEQKRR
jgi:hypothetical protein